MMQALAIAVAMLAVMGVAAAVASPKMVECREHDCERAFAVTGEPPEEVRKAQARGWQFCPDGIFCPEHAEE